MTSYFITLEWKKYFRSSHWQKGIALKIILGFLGLYFIAAFLLAGTSAYFVLKKLYPEQDPFEIVNSFLLYAILGDLSIRYLMQTLPIMNIKPFLILPVEKKRLVHYVLRKSSLSFFNIFGLFFYIPFSVVLINKGYDTYGVLGWLFFMILITQSLNFLNFLINKNSQALVLIAIILGGLIALQKFDVFDITTYGGQFFNTVYKEPTYSLIGLFILMILYRLNYSQLQTQVYLDQALSEKIEEARSVDLSWVNRLGDVAPFIKNDIRLIWRNKRTKTIFLFSFLFLFYGLIFFTQEIYREIPAVLMFASLFVTGGFALNYGQFIPAWDSVHYKMLMSQGFSYRKYLESKWILMVVMTIVLYLLSFPYLYFGVDIFLMISVGAMFNIGFNSFFLLYAGSFNRKRIDLNTSAFGNTQGTSATQFLIIIPVVLFPALMFWLFNKFVGGHSGYIAIAAVGLICLILKNQLMNFIEKKYIKNKYVMINAFEKEA